LHYLERAAERALRAGTAQEARGLLSRAVDVAARQEIVLPRATRARLLRMRAEAAFALADLAACQQDARAALAELGGPLPTGPLGWAALLGRAVLRQTVLRLVPSARRTSRDAERLARVEGAGAAAMLATVFYFAAEWFPMTAAVMLGANLAERA